MNFDDKNILTRSSKQKMKNIQLESPADRYRSVSVEGYLGEIRSHLIELINDLKEISATSFKGL